MIKLLGFIILLLAGVVALFPGHIHARQASFNDPFVYCAAIGTIDRPDAGYTGPQLPDSIVQGLRETTDVPHDAPNDLFTRGTFWRCMDGKVYACFVGANIPCETKADLDRTPSAAMNDYCTNTPPVDSIPAYVTGRATVYEWRCNGGTPTIVRPVTEVDAAGYPAIFWYEINPALTTPGDLPTTGATGAGPALSLLLLGGLLGAAGLLLRRGL